MKGAIWIQDWFAMLLTGVLVVSLPFILPGQVTKISPEIDAQEFENRAMLLANSLMSNENLIYSDSRAVFDEGKLDTNMIERPSAAGILTCPLGPDTVICRMNSYPESFSLILIKDVDDLDREWFSLLAPESVLFQAKLISCYSRFGPSDIENLFDDNADMSQILKIQDCEFNRNTRILSRQGFPVAIRDSSGEMHAGWMKVIVVE